MAADGECYEGLTLPAESFELYRHKDAQKMRTKYWHGYYWAKRNESGDYEIRAGVVATFMLAARLFGRQISPV